MKKLHFKTSCSYCSCKFSLMSLCFIRFRVDILAINLSLAEIAFDCLIISEVFVIVSENMQDLCIITLLLSCIFDHDNVCLPQKFGGSTMFARKF